VAAGAADVVIVTDDNPRSEEPAAIRRSVLEGAHTGTASVAEVADRASAVAQAIGAASAGDVVLILGRGHESHQEVAGEHLALDDRDLVRRALAGEVRA
jgi:UDP-N-acetylmuramoyl-L-alanyl-D-glutamate--2,6-diaminopimelate ligase